MLLSRLQFARKNHDIKITNKVVENVNQLAYLITTVINQKFDSGGD
jgi:hypothetical protein